MLKYLNYITLIISMVCIVGCNSSNIGNENLQRKQIFDFDWKFFQGDAQLAYRMDFNDKDWRNLDLPHDWSIEGKPDAKNPTGGGGGYFPAGIGWYRKMFDAPSAWKGKCISIYFEGVYMNSEVFLNGKSLGIHPYGYTAFLYDLTPYLNFGGKNILSVKVDNSKQMNSRWYSGSGIYRHVWIVITNPVHIATWGVSITTPEVSDQKASVRIKTLIKNETELSQDIVVKTRLNDKNGIFVADNEAKASIPAKSEREIDQTVAVSEPLLWSPENPNLYRCKVEVKQNESIIDSGKTSFGIRTIKFSPVNGFQLNGKTVKINGGCLHHDNGYLGAAAFDRAEIRKVELIKSGGFNAVRTSHNPPSEVFLDACDRLGIMVIDEAFDGWKESKTPFDYSLYFNDWWQRDIESMVLRDRNHPSIIIWSTGNEIIERKKPEAIETGKMLADCIRNIDPTRPVTSAMTTWDKEWAMFDQLFAVHDIGGYNYQLHRAPSDHERVPSRIIVQTESYPRDAFANWKMIRSSNYIIGDFVWTAMDYLGEAGIGRWYYSGETPGEHWEADLFPWHAAYCGDIDLTGWRKPISHYRNMLYNSNEKLYMAVREPETEKVKIKETIWSVWPTWESWTWPGYEGKAMQVEVFSKYPKVRLYLNNNLIGEQATTEKEEFRATFSVPYTPGLLSAAGVSDNKESEAKILQTAGDASGIRLTADRTTISSDGQDLSFITIEITDKDGILQPNAQNLLQLSISGPGVIAGFGNGDIKDIEQYAGNSTKTWHGRALVVVRSTRKAGMIRLTINSAGLPSAILDIKTEFEGNSD